MPKHTREPSKKKKKRNLHSLFWRDMCDCDHEQEYKEKKLIHYTIPTHKRTSKQKIIIEMQNINKDIRKLIKNETKTNKISPII